MKRVIKQIPKVLFNASVVLSGMRSQKGGSGILLSLIDKCRIKGVISETILDEVIRNAHKAGYSQQNASRLCNKLFFPILPAPSLDAVRQHKTVVTDINDAHLFASYEESMCDALVSLDKHHVLALKGKLPGYTIVDPSELINLLKQKKVQR